MYTPNTLETVAIDARLPSGATIPWEHVVDTYQIDAFEFGRDPNDPNSAHLNVVWSKGYTEDGTYTAVDRHSVTFTGVALGLALGGTVPTGVSYYDAVRNALWVLLLQSGNIPPGVVSQ